MNVDELNGSPLLGGSLVLLVAVGAVRLSTRTGTPSLLLYLGLGILLGEGGLGIAFEDFELTTVLGYAALAVILAEGGLTTRWTTIRSAVVPAGRAGHRRHGGVGGRGRRSAPTCCSGWSGCRRSCSAPCSPPPTPRPCSRCCAWCRCRAGWPACSRPSRASTTPRSSSSWSPSAPPRTATTSHSPVLRGARGRRRAGRRCRRSGWRLGWLGARMLRSVALPLVRALPDRGAGALRPRVRRRPTSCTPAGSWPSTSPRSCSATPTCRTGPTVRGFAEGLGWLAQIGLFVLLGLLVSPSGLLDAGRARAGDRHGAAAARPPAVGARLGHAGSATRWRDQAFLSWAGLRGAVPIVLATVPVQLGVPGSDGPVRAGLRPGRGLHPRAGADPARGWPDASGWRPTPRGPRGRELPARGDRRPGAHRRRRAGLAGCTAWSCSSSGCPKGAGVSLVVRDGTSFVPAARHPAAPRRPADGDLPRPGAARRPSAACTC